MKSERTCCYHSSFSAKGAQHGMQRHCRCFYKRRKPQETSLWKLLGYRFLEFEERYDDLFRQQYGFYRPVISHVCKNTLIAVIYIMVIPVYHVPTFQAVRPQL